MGGGLPLDLAGVFGNPTTGFPEVAGFYSQGERERLPIVLLLVWEAKAMGRKAELRSVAHERAR